MPAFVQQVANHIDASTSLTLTLPGNATAGNTVMVTLWVFNNPTVTVSLSGLGASWTKVFEQDMGSFNLCQVWKGTGVAGGSAAVTASAGSTSTYWAGNAAEFSGVNYTGTMTGGLASALTATVPTQTLATGDVAYGQFTWNNSAQTPTYTDAPAGWTSLTIATSATKGVSTQAGYRVAAGSESANRQATFSSGVNEIGYSSILLAASAPAASGSIKRPVTVTRQSLTRAAVR